MPVILFIIVIVALLYLLGKAGGKPRQGSGSGLMQNRDADFHPLPRPGENPLYDAENSPLSRAAKGFGADGGSLKLWKSSQEQISRQDADFPDDAYGRNDGRLFLEKPRDHGRR